MSRKTRKLIWSVPLVVVLAVASALAAFVVLAPNGAQADHIELPGAPMNLTATADGARAIELDWDAPADNGGSAITGYRIDYLPDGTGKVWKELVDDTGDADTEYTDMDDLDPGDQRSYRVFAINSLGTGAVSEVKGTKTKSVGTPSGVTGLEADADGPMQIDLSWDAPDDGGGSPITSYRIHFAGTQAGVPNAGTAVTDDDDLELDTDAASADNHANVIDTDSSSTSYSLTGLRANQRWYFRVYAVNEDGDGVSVEDSDTVDEKTGGAGRPSAPTDFIAVSATDDQTGSLNDISLYWSWPTNDGGANIARFRVEITTGAWPKTTDTPTNAPVADLETNGKAVVEIAPTVETDTAGYNYQHQNIDVDLIGDELNYRVFTETGTGSTLQRSRYAQASATVGDDAIDAPSVVNTGEGATADANDSSKLSLSWGEPSNPGTGYRIDVAMGDNDGGTDIDLKWEVLSPNTNFSDLPYIHKDLKAGQEFYYRVFANPGGPIGIGSTVFSDTTAVAGRPGTVTGLTGTVVDSGQIDLSWNAPSSDGGSAIVRYHIHVGDTRGTIPTDTDAVTVDFDATTSAPSKPDLRANTTAVVATKDASTSYSLKGMWGESTWHIQVYAVNKATSNKSSSGSNIIVRETDEATEIPDPVGLVAEDAEDTQLTDRDERGVLVLWNEPATPSGAMLLHYVAQFKSDAGDGDYEDWTDVPAEETFDTHKNVPDEDEMRVYRIRTVAQINADGDELESDWVEVGYPADTSHTGAGATDLEAPTGVTAESNAAGELTVTWTPGANAVGHLVLLFDSEFNVVETEASPSGNSHTFTGLTAGQHTAVVVSYKSVSDYKYAYDNTTVN